VRNQPGKLGPYGAVLSNALRRGGQQAFDAHAFVLGQSDPGFQALVQELGKEQPKLLRGYTVPIDTSTGLPRRARSGRAVGWIRADRPDPSEPASFDRSAPLRFGAPAGRSARAGTEG